jgi:PhzF family phenazine biosynthesis protein
MGLPIYVVDAFTAEAFRGNPAAVVLGHGPEPWMQALAAEMKHSETAFVRERDDGTFDLRWFTPEVEVDLCGHATLASAHVLFSAKVLAPDATAVFHTRGGVLRATQTGERVTLDFPIAVPHPVEPIPELFAALGVAPREFLRAEGEFFMLVVDDPATVVDLQPDFARLLAVAGVRGVYVTAPGLAGYDIVSRCFAPAVGIDEDPVTGSMHCVLAAYWCPRLGRDEIRAYQASARGGEVHVVRAGDRVLLTGDATVVLAGELHA